MDSHCESSTARVLQQRRLDVSLEKTAICVVSEHGKIVKEVQVASEPEALLRWIFKQDCCRSGFITDYPKQASLSG